MDVTYRAKVRDIIDGNTLAIRVIFPPFAITYDTRIHLQGVEVPNIHNTEEESPQWQEGQRALGDLAQWVRRHGEDIYIQPRAEPYSGGFYGKVYSLQGKSLNEHMEERDWGIK